MGKFIANIINNGIGLVVGFVRQMNANDGWKKVGQWLGEMINQTIKDINGEDVAEAIGGLIKGLLDIAINFFETTNWGEVANKIADILINIDWLGVLTRLINFIWDVWVALQTVRTVLLGRIALALYEWLDKKKQEIIEKITNAMLDFLNVITINGQGIGDVLRKIWANVENWVAQNISPKLTLSYWANRLKPLKEGITKAFKDTFNGVIGIVEKALNYIIRKINTLHWELPDWLGGYSFGFNLKEITIPRLASGGVIDKPTTILAGEYAGASQNPEIVAPQSLLLETGERANIPVMNAIEEMGDKLVEALNSIGVYAEFDYSKLKVGLDNENYRVGGKLYGI